MSIFNDVKIVHVEGRVNGIKFVIIQVSIILELELVTPDGYMIGSLERPAPAAGLLILHIGQP